MNLSDDRVRAVATDAAGILAPVFERQGWTWSMPDGSGTVPALEVIAGQLERQITDTLQSARSMEPEDTVFARGGRIFVTLEAGQTELRVFLEVGFERSGDEDKQKPVESGKALDGLRRDEFDCHFDEGERQLILLALQKLRIERPGFDYALSQIEQQLGGQIDWPPYSEESPGAADLLRLVYAGALNAAATAVRALPVNEVMDLGSILPSLERFVAEARYKSASYDNPMVAVENLRRRLAETTLRFDPNAEDEVGLA